MGPNTDAGETSTGVQPHCSSSSRQLSAVLTPPRRDVSLQHREIGTENHRQPVPRSVAPSPPLTQPLRLRGHCGRQAKEYQSQRNRGCSEIVSSKKTGAAPTTSIGMAAYTLNKDNRHAKGNGEKPARPARRTAGHEGCWEHEEIVFPKEAVTAITNLNKRPKVASQKVIGWGGGGSKK